MNASSPPPAPASLGEDARTIGLVGLAHGTSHFFHMLLPPLFPLFMRDFGLSYAELGLLVTVFFVVSGIGQALSGFLVDRVGARPVLFAALACFAAAAASGAMANGYPGLMLAAALSGLGNSPFHPVDFTILNKRVSASRLGHAYSVHGITGNLGWASAPVFLLGLTGLTGSWRLALGGAALLALAVLGLVVWQRAAIDDRVMAGRVLGGARAAGPAAGGREHPLAFLALPSVWLCFSFFFWSTIALSAVLSFASPALQAVYGLPLSTAAFVVTAYTLASACGTVVGGFLVTRVERLERTIGSMLLVSAVLFALAGSGWLPGLAAAGLVALAGFGSGLAAPSRDMLIKQATPPGATGRVYGTVYSGLDLGFAIGAPVLGGLLDLGLPKGVFFGAALALVMAVVSASFVGLRIAARRAPAVPA